MKDVCVPDRSSRLPALAARALTVLLVAATVALAGFEDAAKRLEGLLTGSDFQAQAEAVDALVDTGDARAVPLLVERVFLHPDQYVFERALVALRDRATTPQKHELVRLAAARTGPQAKAILLDLLGTLGALDGADEAVASALADKAWTVRAAAIRAARARTSKALIPALIDRVGKEDGRLASDLTTALRELTGADFGTDREGWKAWWEAQGEGVTLRPLPPPAEEADEAGAGGGRPLSGREKKVDVGTLSREPLYEVASQRIVFVVDVSGSMATGTDAGSRLDLTKRALAQVLEEQLTDDAVFNVLWYSSKVESWKPKAVKATGANRKAARKVVDKLKADGLTATYDALKAAFALEDIDTIYLLSDGIPSVGGQTISDMILKEVRTWNRGRGLAIHTIALLAGEDPKETHDKARAAEFMKALALENGGTFKLVE